MTLQPSFANKWVLFVKGWFVFYEAITTYLIKGNYLSNLISNFYQKHVVQGWHTHTHTHTKNQELQLIMKN